jgi:hypothetical protein
MTIIVYGSYVSNNWTLLLPEMFWIFFRDSISVAIVTHCRRYQPCSSARYSSSRPMLVFHLSMTRWLKTPQLIQSETSHRIIEVVLMSPTNGATPCFLSLWILSSVIPLCRGPQLVSSLDIFRSAFCMRFSSLSYSCSMFCLFPHFLIWSPSVTYCEEYNL